MKKLSLITGIAMALGLSAQVFAEGNGSGYGGPDLAAEVIPREFNGITFSDIEKAAKICILEGDASRGIVSLAQRIVETLYPEQGIQNVQGPVDKPTIESMYSGAAKTSEEWNDKLAQSLENVGNEFGLTLQVSYGPQVVCHDALPEVGNSGGCFANGPNGFKGWLGLSTRGSFWYQGVSLPSYQGRPLDLAFSDPQGHRPKSIEDNVIISFKEMNYLPKYDRFGRVESSTLSFDGVKVKAEMPVLRFLNNTTGHPLDLTVSQVEAVRCMRTELQKAAK